MSGYLIALIASGGTAIAVAMIAGIVLARSCAHRSRTGSSEIDVAIEQAQEQIDKGRMF
jgi:hypothetical protein